MKKEKYEKKKKNDKYIIIYNRIKQNKLIIISEQENKRKTNSHNKFKIVENFNQFKLNKNYHHCVECWNVVAYQIVY